MQLTTGFLLLLPWEETSMDVYSHDSTKSLQDLCIKRKDIEKINRKKKRTNTVSLLPARF